MFQLSASGTPRAVLEQIDRQNAARGANPSEDGLRNKVIGLVRDTAQAADQGHTFTVQALGSQEGGKVKTLSLHMATTEE
jgi:hypothetical protein